MWRLFSVFRAGMPCGQLLVRHSSVVMPVVLLKKRRKQRTDPKLRTEAISPSVLCECMSMSRAMSRRIISVYLPTLSPVSFLMMSFR